MEYNPTATPTAEQLQPTPRTQEQTMASNAYEDDLPGSLSPAVPLSPPITRMQAVANQLIASRLRSRDSSRPHAYLGDLSSHISALVSTPTDPLTHRVAMRSPYASKWTKAGIKGRYRPQVARNVWKLVPSSTNGNIISCNGFTKPKKTAMEMQSGARQD